MKRLLFLGLLAVSLASCKSASPTNTKVAGKEDRAIKGNWTISSVSFPGSDYIKVTSFGLADSKCFEGSAWKFVSNNDTGTMALQTSVSGCPSFSSPIKWYVNKDGQFVLKVLNAGEKAKKVRDGYVLGMANQTETSFQLLDNIDVGGHPTSVIYNFQKVN